MDKVKLIETIVHKPSMVKQFVKMGDVENQLAASIPFSKIDSDIGSSIPYSKMLDKRRVGAANRRSWFYRIFCGESCRTIVCITVFAITIIAIRGLEVMLEQLTDKLNVFNQQDYKYMCNMDVPMIRYNIKYDGRMPFEGSENCPYIQEANISLIDTSVYESDDVGFPVYFNVTENGVYAIEFTTRLLSLISAYFEIHIEQVLDGVPNIELAAFSFLKDGRQTHQAILALRTGDVFFFHMITAMVTVDRPKVKILKLFNLHDPDRDGISN